MVATLPFFGFLSVVLGVFWQFFARDKLQNTFGVGRPITSRGHTRCEKLSEFEACEDGWYHQPSGLLYLACSSLEGRTKWLPNADVFDLEKRPETDYLAILDTKATGSVASRTTIVKPENFVGTNGKGSYNLHGIGVHVEDDDNLRIFLINHRPQPNPHSNGANSTIELFESKLGSDSMQHVRTYADEVILTPNDLTPIGPDSFIFSNDHSVKVGQLKKLDIFAARSSVGRCDKNGCRKVIEKYLYPNGIAGGTQFPNPNPNLVYIGSSAQNLMTVVETQADGSVVKLDEIPMEYPVDNLSVDADGNVWAAGFPNLFKMLGHMANPREKHSPTVLFKTSKNKGQDAFYGQKYISESVVEDDGSTLSGLTFVQYDTERRLTFAGGVFTPYVAICKV